MILITLFWLVSETKCNKSEQYYTDTTLVHLCLNKLILTPLKELSMIFSVKKRKEKKVHLMEFIDLKNFNPLGIYPFLYYKALQIFSESKINLYPSCFGS